MTDAALLMVGVAVLLVVFAIGGAVIEWFHLDERWDARRRNGR